MNATKKVRATGPTTDLAGELRTAVNRLAYHLRGPATRSGVTPSRLAAMSALAKQEDGCRQGDLAAQLGMSAPSMTRLVEVMLDSGWVVRERDPLDQRAQLIRLSEEGRHTLDAVRSEGATRLGDELSTLDPDQRRVLEDAVPVLRKLADRWLAHEADPEGAPRA